MRIWNGSDVRHDSEAREHQLSRGDLRFSFGLSRRKPYLGQSEIEFKIEYDQTGAVSTRYCCETRCRIITELPLLLCSRGVALRQYMKSSSRFCTQAGLTYADLFEARTPHNCFSWNDFDNYRLNVGAICGVGGFVLNQTVGPQVFLPL